MRSLSSIAMVSSERGARLPRPGGFTLAELLVVVCMICLLMSLSLPALTEAERRGEQIQCLANQHQLVFAWLLYSTDHDDKLCAPRSYRSALRPYVQTEEIFLCKTGEARRKGVIPRKRDSYGVSNTMGGVERDGVRPYEKLHRISHPGEKLVLVDRAPNAQTCFWPLLRTEQETWVWRPWSLYLGLQGMTGRHSNGCNLSFADGHGQYRAWRDDRTRKLIAGRMADSGRGSANNDDLQYMVRVLTYRSNGYLADVETGRDGARNP